MQGFRINFGSFFGGQISDLLSKCSESLLPSISSFFMSPSSFFSLPRFHHFPDFIIFFVSLDFIIFFVSLEVTTAQVFYFRAAVTSSAEMEVKTFPAKLLDKTFWNPRPEIDLASRAVSGESGSSHLFLGHQN